MKRFLSTFISSLVIILGVFSQIKVRENVKIDAIDYSPVDVYDSIADFGIQNKNTDYLKYIGQELYLPPLGKQYKFGNTQELITKIAYEYTPDTVTIDWARKGNEFYENKKREIGKIETNIYKPYISVNITYHNDILIHNSKSTYNKYYKIINITDKKNQSLREVNEELNGIKIWLKSETNDTVLIIKEYRLNPTKTLYPFIVKGFYEKELKTYVEKKLFVYDNPNKYIDVNTGELISPQIGDIWYCKDIYYIDIPNYCVLEPYFFLTNGKNEIKVELGKLLESGFITLKQLDILYKNWLIENETIKNKNTKQAFNRQKNCEKYFGTDICNKLLNGKIEIGMTKEMILYTFGEPYRSYTIKTASDTKEIYSYGGTIIYFTNGIITTITIERNN